MIDFTYQKDRYLTYDNEVISDASVDEDHPVRMIGSEIVGHLHRVVVMPKGDRVFIIGGSMYTNGVNPLNQTIMLTKEENGKFSCVKKSSMHAPRSAFGVAMYPSFKQIFVVGGSIGENDVTKTCERYIIEDDIWKRLPELNEPKGSASVCFFNKGSSIYCFGGIIKNSEGILQATDSIERLSKGENYWKKL